MAFCGKTNSSTYYKDENKVLSIKITLYYNKCKGLDILMFVEST